MSTDKGLLTPPWTQSLLAQVNVPNICNEQRVSYEGSDLRKNVVLNFILKQMDQKKKKSWKVLATTKWQTK